MSTIVDTGWAEQYISALVLLNLMLGYPQSTEPYRETPPESVVRTLNEIAVGAYKPTEHFLEGAQRSPLRLQQKECVPTELYTVIVLNARSSRSDFLSVNLGGVIFEDPVWAVFAAMNISKKQMFALPLAGSDNALWQHVPDLEAAARASKYDPAHFFAPATGFSAPGVARFSLMQISGAQLDGLRKFGARTFGSPPLFYELYAKPAGTVQ